MSSKCYHLASQGRHLRRPGEEESDVDIEGFEEEDDGKPKTPAPVREIFLKELCSYVMLILDDSKTGIRDIIIQVTLFLAVMKSGA